MRQQVSSSSMTVIVPLNQLNCDITELLQKCKNKIGNQNVLLFFYILNLKKINVQDSLHGLFFFFFAYISSHTMESENLCFIARFIYWKIITKSPSPGPYTHTNTHHHQQPPLPFLWVNDTMRVNHMASQFTIYYTKNDKRYLLYHISYIGYDNYIIHVL